jgi:hypothetical protein
MKYALLIYQDETTNMNLGEQEQQEVMQAHGAFYGEAAEAGVAIPGGTALYPTTTARSVRVRDGETLVTDGPFAETREQLGGLYMVECDSIEEACSWAAKVPEAKAGVVEVRQIMVFD